MERMNRGVGEKSPINSANYSVNRGVVQARCLNVLWKGMK